MALDQQQLADTLGIDVADIKTAVESEDTVKLTLDGIRIVKKDETIFTEEEVTTLKGNHEKELKDKEVKSNQIGRELLLKELKEQEGLEYEGRKDPNNFIKAYRDKVTKELGGEPDEKVKSLEGDLEKVRGEYTSLQDQFKEKDVEITNIKTEYKQKEDKVFVNKELKDAYKDKKDLFRYESDDLIKLYLLENNTRVDDGKVIPLDSNGDPVKNKLADIESVGDHFHTWAEETGKFKKPEGGRGDDFTPGSGVKTISDFEKSMKAKGTPVGSTEYNRELQAAMENGSVKDD